MDRLLIKVGNRYLFVNIDSIDWIEAEGNYMRIHKGKESHLIRETLFNLEKKLNPAVFIRVNRSTIINVNRIKELRSLKYSNVEVHIEGGQSWIWGKKYRKSLQRLFHQFKTG